MRMPVLFTAMACVMACAPAMAAQAGGHAQTDAAMDAIVAHGESHPLAAIAAVRMHEGRIAYSYYGGFARRTEHGDVPVGPDTLFRIASISKLVTTIGLMELVEQGRISLDGDISDYLGFRVRNPDFPDAPITVRMLLNHTSTLADANGYTLPPDHRVAELFGPDRKPGDAGYHFAHGAGHRPGTWFEYSNLGFGLIGTIIERVSGERFDRYQQAHVLTPLGIDGGYNVTELRHPERLATLYTDSSAGYAAQVDTLPPKGWPAQLVSRYVVGSNGTIFSPQGGLRVSIAGLARLARFMQQGGTLEGTRLLSTRSIHLMETPTWQYDGHDGSCPYPIASYGLGMIQLTGGKDPDGRPTAPYRGYHGHLRGHLGDAYGLHSGFWYDTANGDAFVFAADGYPDDDSATPGAYSSFTRVEEQIFTTLAGAAR
ncbi:serine hydrolase domain-containing protein [Novacetimonas pomaceti]|nr:serine hydrolase domain-containing protein [Novacetimonas pomaceti]